MLTFWPKITSSCRWDKFEPYHQVDHKLGVLVTCERIFFYQKSTSFQDSLFHAGFILPWVILALPLLHQSTFEFSLHFWSPEHFLLTTLVLYIYVCIYISEKAMAPHSSTLAWRIPWTEESGRLQTMGSLRVEHN